MASRGWAAPEQRGLCDHRAMILTRLHSIHTAIGVEPVRLE